MEGDATRSVRYHNVAPGRYRFRVIASNNDGIWNQVGATVTLILEPHFWQTLIFKLALVAAAIALVTILFRARVKRLRDIANLRVQIAADLHDDVGSRLTKVAMLTEHLDGQTPQTEKNKFLVKNIARTTREIIQSMDEIVWTINPKNDTLDNLANYIFQYAQDYFQNTSVRCRMDLPAGLPDSHISTEERHNLFMAVKEALNNVLKHSGASEVRLALTLVDTRLIITITDNGSGFLTQEKRPSGDGLDNMKQRLERIGGRLVLESEPGGGTTFVIALNPAETDFGSSAEPAAVARIVGHRFKQDG
jgi:signal transduction histidine kinase